jgi:hypothetical protein
MTERMIYFSWLLLIFIPPRITYADETNVTTPWDTVVAEIQIIEHSTVEDSLKNKLMAELFTRYNLTEKDYRSFYEHFLVLPPKQQREFLERVKTIVPRLVKLEELAPPSESSRVKIPQKKKE